ALRSLLSHGRLAQPGDRRLRARARHLPQHRRGACRHACRLALAAGRSRHDPEPSRGGNHSAGENGNTGEPMTTNTPVPANGVTVLVVEDEPKLAELVVRYLEASGYAARRLVDGRDVVPAVRQSTPDLIMLDLMLPGRDGVDICRELRNFSDVPIVMMTARVEEIDRLLGLELGADDYVCKPFSPRELVARVRAILRRTRGAP